MLTSGYAVTVYLAWTTLGIFARMSNRNLHRRGPGEQTHRCQEGGELRHLLTVPTCLCSSLLYTRGKGGRHISRCPPQKPRPDLAG